MASYHEVMIHEIHVLLVDHDPEGLLNTAKMLEICQYRVTFVELASAAISMLLSGKAKFDVVMANVNSPDLHGFKLLQQAVTMGLPVIVMSVDDNTFMAMRALENGAFLYIKKPATMDMLRCLWQHVLRERMRIMKERDLLMAASVAHGAQGVRFREVTHPKEENGPNNLVGGKTTTMKSNGKFRKCYGGRHGLEEDGEFEFEKHMNVRNNVRRKMCTEWTHELHAKFMDAVEQLGEGRCFPKEILELMNVPGLTRMQVASHLQKCRNDNWRSPEERKSNQSTQPTSTETNGSQHKTRRFGSKPQLGKTFSGRVQENNLETGQGSEINSEVNNNPSHYRHYGSFGPGPSNITPGANSSSKYCKHSSEEFFNLPDMDCLIQNLPGSQQRSGLNNPNPDAGATYNFNPTTDYHVQNSGGQSMDTKSHWSSDTSNFESDHSESRSHE